MDSMVNVAAAIIVFDGKVLAAQRGEGELAGGWEFPGGKIEAGETAEQACIREIDEELGVAICDLAPFVTLEYACENFRMHLETFVCRIANGSPQSREHSELRWLTPDELLGIEWLPADVQVANALHVYLMNGANLA